MLTEMPDAFGEQYRKELAAKGQYIDPIGSMGALGPAVVSIPTGFAEALAGMQHNTPAPAPAAPPPARPTGAVGGPLQSTGTPRVQYRGFQMNPMFAQALTNFFGRSGWMPQRSRQYPGPELGSLLVPQNVGNNSTFDGPPVRSPGWPSVMGGPNTQPGGGQSDNFNRTLMSMLGGR